MHALLSKAGLSGLTTWWSETILYLLDKKPDLSPKILHLTPVGGENKHFFFIGRPPDLVPKVEVGCMLPDFVVNFYGSGSHMEVVMTLHKGILFLNFLFLFLLCWPTCAWCPSLRASPHTWDVPAGAQVMQPTAVCRNCRKVSFSTYFRK